jgi:hypothetical protein
MSTMAGWAACLPKTGTFAKACADGTTKQFVDTPVSDTGNLSCQMVRLRLLF